MESRTNIYPRPYCMLSNAPEELGYKLQDTAGVSFAHDYTDRQQVTRYRFRGIDA
jgi:hypothetical protein